MHFALLVRKREPRLLVGHVSVDELAGTQCSGMTSTAEVKQVVLSVLGSGDSGQFAALGLKVLTDTGEEYGQDEFQRIGPLNSGVCLNPGCNTFQKSSRQSQIPIRQIGDMKKRSHSENLQILGATL